MVPGFYFLGSGGADGELVLGNIVLAGEVFNHHILGHGGLAFFAGGVGDVVGSGKVLCGRQFCGENCKKRK